MNAKEVREKYLKFFEKRGHKIIPPAPLVLQSDPTTLFTSSGMQPLVRYLLGEKHPEGVRLVDCQPCLRVQDIEEVGDNRHDTYFQMLGNWSLGDYFKESQIPWIFEFFTKELGIDPKKLYITVFRGIPELDIPRDTEAVAIWKEVFKEAGIEAQEADYPEKEGLRDGRIFYYDEKKNWWSRAGTPEQMPIGEPGGPSSEVFFDFGPEWRFHENSKFKDEPCHVNCDCGRFVEIGNNVFMTYIKTKDGFTPLENKNIDFGGGLERIVMATENEPDMYKTSLFEREIEKIEEITGKKYGEDETDTRNMRIVAEHVRAAAELIKDGVVPGNKQQGYILRRLIRRSALSMKRLKEALVKTDLSFTHDEEVNSALESELERFLKTLAQGLKVVSKIEKIDAKQAFDLYQSYGFPLEITEEIFEEKGQKIDRKAFHKAFEEHKNTSRSAAAGTFKGGLADHSEEVTRLHSAHHLLLASLQKLIDPSIRQRGSNITGERLRVDFNFDRKLTDDEIESLERLMSEKVNEALPITKKTMPRTEAEKIGAQMEFGTKYPDRVNVYFIGDPEDYFSAEFCGGPHVDNTSKIGRVKIIKSEKQGAGIVRVYAKITD